jgi:hypothetical protein
VLLLLYIDCVITVKQYASTQPFVDNLPLNRGPSLGLLPVLFQTVTWGLSLGSESFELLFQAESWGLSLTIVRLQTG